MSVVVLSHKMVHQVITFLPFYPLLYLSSYDLSFHSFSSPFAAEGVRSVEMLQLLHEWGVPFKETLMSTAIYEENILLLRHLLLPSSSSSSSSSPSSSSSSSSSPSPSPSPSLSLSLLLLLDIEMIRLLHEFGVGFEADGRSFAPVLWSSENSEGKEERGGERRKGRGREGERGGRGGRREGKWRGRKRGGLLYADGVHRS